ARVNINKREIDHAFTQRPNSLIIYVFGQQGGRMRDEDAVAFNAINKAYPLNIQSLLLVVNGLPAVRPKDYEGEVMLMLQDIIQLQVAPERVCFLNHINRENIQERHALRKQLLNAIVELTPTEHIKAQDIHLKVDEVEMLKKQIEEMTKTFEANKIEFQHEIREHQKRYDELMENQKNETDSLRRIIERQQEEAAEARLSQEDRERELQQQMETMRADHQRLTEQLATASQEQARQLQAALQASSQQQAELMRQLMQIRSQPPQVVTQGKKSCFVGGTLIRMADGTDKSIEKIQVGDVVLGAENQSHVVMFLDVEQLNGRHLHGINDFPPFFTSEHVFFTSDGKMSSIEPQDSENEEPSLRGLVNALQINDELQGLDQNRRPSTIVVNQLNCTESDSTTTVYNVVLDSGHTYYANGFCVFDMFPNLAQYPRMFKFLHLLWQSCATQIDSHFDDIVTPGSDDRLRLEKLADFVQQAISSYLSKN
ncbi:unnamed protein product, partial [Rotaria sp. Silwood2]